MSVHFHASNKDLMENWREEPKSIGKYQFVYHFLPHPHRKERAKLLSHHALALYCVAIAFFIGLFNFIPKVAPGLLGYASDITVSDLLDMTNKKRKADGLSSLRLNKELSAAADKKAKHMFAKNYWAHVAPDGTEPWDFILGQNYDYLYAGENLAKNFSTSQQVVAAWMNSPSHRENLMSSNYDEIGFAVVNGVLDGYETTLVVQMFGRPRAASQIASVGEEEQLLQDYKAQPEIPVAEAQEVPTQEAPVSGNTLPLVDVSTAARSISMSFAMFIGSLLSIDVWYSRKKGILKLNGHTVTHLMLLLLVIVGVWFVLKPGVIL